MLLNFLQKAGMGALGKIGAAYKKAGADPRVYVHAPPPRAGGAPEDTLTQVNEKFGLSPTRVIQPMDRGAAPYDYLAEFQTRSGNPVTAEFVSKPQDKRLLIQDNARFGLNRHFPTEKVMQLVGDRPMLNYDTMLLNRGQGGSEVYQGLWSMLNNLDAYNGVVGLTEINRARRPANMMSFIARHPESHNRVLLSGETTILDPRNPKTVPISPEQWTELSPEEKLGWLAMRERLAFDLDPTVGGGATGARSGQSGLTQMMMNILRQDKKANVEDWVDESIGRGMWDKTLYKQGGLVR